MATGGHLERFLKAVHDVHATGAGVPETSYYPAISRLLEDVGATLTPKVAPVINLSDRGAGIPDGGLFVARGRSTRGVGDLAGGRVPDRGAIEVKPPAKDLAKVVGSGQVRRYLERYGKVVVTTLRDWTLAVQDPAGKTRRPLSFQFAASEDAFWALAAHPKAYAAAHEAEFVDFVRQVLEHDAPLSSPRDLAWTLATHARAALERIESTDVQALEQLRAALSDSLGLTFDEDEGEHFFRSTLVQTLFYGVFSAWVLWNLSGPSADARFQWKEAAWYLRVPMVSVLFERIATPSTLRPLGVEEIMDWTEDALARVDRERFFDRFEQGKAVQYFYEPFLEHFDQQLREQFGVWYTPPEVVDYMVERVDQVLRSELGIAKGLADDRVVVLDPCVGTGSFMLAVLAKIRDALPNDALAAQDLKRAALTRVFGFEILPAPYVVAHMQLGLLLDHLGAPLDASGSERVPVFLTNSLTGWGEDHPDVSLPFPELEEEREAAHSVKRDAKVLVVLGNPPYYPFAGVNSAEEAGLIEAYREGITTRNSLNDLYVRFFRVAERRIVEGTGHGIVCLISNFSYLHEPGFASMRRILLGEFDSILVDNLNGDSRETGKRTPEGRPDPSIFSTPWNRQGIQVGTAVSTLVRRPEHGAGQARVRYRDFWGAGKQRDLLTCAHSADPEAGYEDLVLMPMNRFAFRPSRVGVTYESWPQVVELAAADPVLGLNENRGGVLVDADRETLAERLRSYFDPSVSLEQLKASRAERLSRQWAGFDPAVVRQRAMAASFTTDRIVRFLALPLDCQWAYVDSVKGLWNRHRPELLAQAREGNHFLLVRRRAPRLDDGAALLPGTCLGDQHALHKDAYFIPALRFPDAGAEGLFGAADPVPNLSAPAVTYLRGLGLEPSEHEYASLLWWHALAIAYAPQYVADNPGGIAADWPRIPLPSTAAALRESAGLGERLALLLDPLQPMMAGLPSLVGAIRRVDGRAAQPGLGHLEVRAQWGTVQKSGAVMPGRGRLVRRSFSPEELEALGPAAGDLGEACDVYLNEGTYWSCIPSPVWEYKIGGFQVLKKWLSYREHGGGQPGFFGRGLTIEEAREFTALAQRLTGVVLMQPALDANYAATVVAPAPWPPTTTLGPQ